MRYITHTLYTCIMYVPMQVPLFQNTEIGFTKLLALSIEPQLFLSKEYIVKKGDIGSEVTHTVLCVMYSAVAIYSPMLFVAVSVYIILYLSFSPLSLFPDVLHQQGHGGGGE